MSSDSTVYDLIGLGFGPASLALSGALIEKWDDPSVSQEVVPRNILFLEKQDTFRWHPGMLLPGARMQISFMKDLATLRSPRSPITFLNYLHIQNRLISFINRGSTVPTRKEYADYLGWVARYVQEHGVKVCYGQEVVAFSEGEDGLVHIQSRDVLTGDISVHRARSIALAPGGKGDLPPAIASLTPHPRVFHSSVYVTSIGPALDELVSNATSPLRIAVVGSGQSAAEVLLDVHDRLGRTSIPAGAEGRHQIDMIFRKGSLKPSDDSPFSNEIFDPSSTDFMFNLPNRRTRQHVLSEYKPTNYSVANPRTIDTLYEVIYEQNLDESIARREARFLTTPKITLRPYSSIVSAEHTLPESPSPSYVSENATPTLSYLRSRSNASDRASITLTLQDVLTRRLSEHAYDVVVCGTGYDRTGWIKLIAESGLAKRFGLAGAGTVVPADVEIVPVLADGIVPKPVVHESSSPSPSSSSSGSPSLSTGDLAENEPCTLYVSRSYRLLPVEGEGKDLGPRVYLQGCLERTHGLSDTLLSVMGVKAGEIVDDLMRG